MHTAKTQTSPQTDITAADYKRPVLRKRFIRDLRRFNHGVN